MRRFDRWAHAIWIKIAPFCNAPGSCWLNLIYELAEVNIHFRGCPKPPDLCDSESGYLPRSHWERSGPLIVVRAWECFRMRMGEWAGQVSKLNGVA